MSFKVNAILMACWLSLSGCMTLPVSGKVDKTDEYFSGSATGDLFGSGTLNIVSTKNATCEGKFKYIDIPKFGKGFFVCNDGRSGPFQFTSDGVKGEGYGEMGDNRFSFVFGNDNQLFKKISDGNKIDVQYVNNKSIVATNKDHVNTVPLEKSEGVYYVPALLNNVINIKFVIDSGAAEVSISPDIALTLIKARTVTENDFLPGMIYQLADGSKVKSDRFILRSLKIGDAVLKDDPCSISNSLLSPLLLGQSALEKLGSVTFDYNSGVVIFKK